jgi:hypothetical protein
MPVPTKYIVYYDTHGGTYNGGVQTEVYAGVLGWTDEWI